MREAFDFIVKKDISLPLSFLAPIILGGSSLIFSVASDYGEYKNKFKEAEEKVQRLEAGQQALTTTIERNSENTERLNSTLVQLGERLKGLEKSIDRLERK